MTLQFHCQDLIVNSPFCLPCISLYFSVKSIPHFVKQCRLEILRGGYISITFANFKVMMLSLIMPQIKFEQNGVIDAQFSVFIVPYVRRILHFFK